MLLDTGSLAFARERLAELEDPLLRQLLWTSIWDMVRDARLRSTDFLVICRRILPDEPDLELVNGVLTRVARCLADYIPEARRLAESRSVLDAALDAMAKTASQDARIVWMRAAIMAAATPADLEPLRAIADGRAVIDGFSVDQDMRWSLATLAAALGSTTPSTFWTRNASGTGRTGECARASRPRPRDRRSNPRRRRGAGSTPKATARTT